MDTVTNARTIRTKMDASTLDAFVDGALSPEDAARVVLHLADCPGDQAYVDAVMETNALLAAAYAEPLHQALPERLRASIFPADATAAQGRRPTRTGWRLAAIRPARLAWGALAASVALAFGVAVGLAPARFPAGGSLAGLPEADGTLRAALETSPSGLDATAGGAQINLIATFVGGDGRPCRQFEVVDRDAAAVTQGVACREGGGGWTDEIAVASRLSAPESNRDGFVPASGAGDDALDATLDRLGVGMALTPGEEQALIAAGWSD